MVKPPAPHSRVGAWAAPVQVSGGEARLAPEGAYDEDQRPGRHPMLRGRPEGRNPSVPSGRSHRSP